MLIKKLLKYSVLTVAVLLSCNSCYLDGVGSLNRISGEGEMFSEKFDVPKFHGIVIRNSANLTLSQGSDQKLVVKAQRNILDNIKTDVSDGILYISNRNPVWRTKPIQVKIRMSDLTHVKLSGSGNISTTDQFTDLDDLEVKVSGSGKISLDIQAREVYGSIGGSGNIDLKGKAKETEFSIGGSGSINAYDLKSKRAYAKISGSGGIHIDVEDDLEARISGSGSIIYEGNPDVEKHRSGSGSIRSR